MARYRSIIVVALAGVALVACAGQPAGPSAAEAACTARGLLPGTAQFAACLNPSEAAALRQGEAGWQQMQDVEQ